MAIVRITAVALLIGVGGAAAAAQRERMRLTPRGTTEVTESQAGELTLTLSEVAIRPIQIWVRTAGTIDEARRTLTADVPPGDRDRVKVGQRARAFSPDSRSRMYQATIAQVAARGGRVSVRATLAGQALDVSRHFILEIVTENDELLSVPNEAIIESGNRPRVYVQQSDGSYAPRDVRIGIRGELYSEVADGLKPGERVVTIGSFFIDAEHALKGS